ncbi:Gfo/Idh/MocA family oxidoreductase [Pelagibacteraceae bacterium]|nr:Gfo/Idh/MocA family oxidoreductase [Pelagibacteraceae bacterium]
MKTYKIGILGVSSVASKRFIPAILKLKNIQIKFVASRSIKKAEMIGKSLNCEYGNYKSLFDNSDKLDIVYISTPPNKRTRYYKECIKNELHIFAEKPSFINYLEAKKILSYSNLKNVFFFECWMFKFHPQHLTIKNLLDQKLIGEINYFESKFFYPRPNSKNIRLKKNLKGGVLFDSIGYPINAFNLFFNTKKMISNYFTIKDKKTKVEKLVNVQLSNGKVIANLSSGFDNNYESFYKIYGNKGTIQLNRCFSIDENFKNHVIINKNDKIKKIIIKPFDQFSLMVKNFLHIIEKNVSIKKHNSKMLNYITLFDEIFNK